MPNQILKSRATAATFALTAKETLRELLEREALAASLDLVALYNWGTKEKRQINRMLVERLGCEKPEADPLDSVLDPALALRKTLYKPEAYVPPPLALEKTHTVNVKRRLPVPAVAITKLTRWFVPETGKCEIEYLLEGVEERAKEVDLEIHAARYYKVKSDAETKCGTIAGEDDTTHIYAKRVFTVAGPAPDVPQKEEWKGQSTATAGVLEKPGGADCYINAGCAPYNAMVRYFADDADKKAKIVLRPFFPRWKGVKNAAPALDDASLVVTWDIADDNGKLKEGRLVVWDRDDKEVFAAALDETRLRVDKKYDLLNDAAKKWDKAQISRAKMPYRVQLQAHSDDDEEKGLAVAVMPTQVPALQYQKVQLVAFNVGPGTKNGAYLGDADDDADIAVRCGAMKDAIQAALPSVDTADDVLKVFMAPEFYFRGSKGAYELEKLSTIPTTMNEETGKIAYADWLFVYGTAIGQLANEDVDNSGAKSGNVRTYSGDSKINARIASIDDSGADTKITITLRATFTPEAGWSVEGLGKIDAVAKGAGDWTLTLHGKQAAVVGPVVLLQPLAEIEAITSTKKVEVRSPVCARIPDVPLPAFPWTARQGGLHAEIAKVTPKGGGRYTLDLGTATNFVVGPFTLEEPLSTEVFNVALVQKGWPVQLPGPAALKSALVYKEHVSPIDFLGTNFGKGTDFHHSSGSGRIIDIDGATDRVVLPTSGSRDLLGASPNLLNAVATWKGTSTGTTNRVGSQLNLSGIGGGTVLTIDDVTFGLEVCLDHAENLVSEFYKSGTKAGDPALQVHLIPSWGMTIGGGELCPPRAASPYTLTFNVDGGTAESVARLNDGAYACDTHPAKAPGAPGNCDVVLEFYVCTACHAVIDEHPGNCPTHGTPTVKYYACAACGDYFAASVLMCGNCHATTPATCDEAYVQIGTLIPTTVAKTAVASSAAGTHFQRSGYVTVYAVEDLPELTVV